MAFYQSPLELRRLTTGEVPKIDFRRLFRVMRTNPYGLMQWTTGFNNVGQAIVRLLGPIASVNYQFLDNTGSHYINLDLPTQSNAEFVLGKTAECPTCCADVCMLYYYLQRWRCRECHNLKYASQRVSPHTRWSQKKAQLEYETTRSRRRLERVKTFRKRRAEALLKHEKLGPPPPWSAEQPDAELPQIMTLYGTQWDELR